MNRFALSLRSWQLVVALLLAVAAEARADASWSALVSPDNSYRLMFLHGETTALNLTVGGWGANWGWVQPPTSTQAAQNGVLHLSAPFTINHKSGEVITVACEAAKAEANGIKLHYALSSSSEVHLTALVATLTMAEDVHDGKVIATLAEGGEKTIPEPGPNAGEIKPTSNLQFIYKDGTTLTVAIEPACPLQLSERGIRIVLAADTFPQGSKDISITISTPESMNFVADDQGKKQFVKTVASGDWFPFNAKGNLGPSVIGMEDWMDAPAGKHGGVRMVGDHFQFEDGHKVKFWGANLSYAAECAPQKQDADRAAAKFAKYGINGVRLHKFLGPLGWQGINSAEDATKFDPTAFDRFDYFCDRLTHAGVYYGFSHTFDLRVGPENRDRLLAYDEIANNGDKTMGLINFADDVQDILIERLVTLLKHRNPYTGKTYAEDPALSYVEIQNEDDIFFFTTGQMFEKCPTYYKKVQEEFSEWLQKKYGSMDKLQEAWGGGLKPNESMEGKNIDLQGNPWYMGEKALVQFANNAPRMLDNAAFFHELQERFYNKAVKAIRDTGYQGPLVGSPWQAPTMVPHYYNLKSDYEVGYIDRHNYFGEKSSDTMLTHPGSGFLGSGLQQVADRPFGVSEWIDCYPCLYTADGPPIMAAYGLGLQGWDASYEFQTSSHNMFHKLAGELPYGAWNADVPTQLGQYPTLSRMVMRGDVKEGDIISTRRVSPQELETGKFSFSDKIAQSGDIKSFGGSVPSESLAAGRDVVEFVDQSKPSDLPDMSKFVSGKSIKSNTGELLWDHSDRGFFTINTDATKAVVGFANDKPITLGNVKITSQSDYASIIVTALDRNATLATTKGALISVVARNVNSGMQLMTLDEKIINNGGPPILIEPVKAKLSFTGRPIAAVNVLDQDGIRTGKTLETSEGSFAIDGSHDKTLYYEIVFR